MKFMSMITTSNGDKAGEPPPELMQAIMELGMQAGKKLEDNGGMALTGVARIEAGQLIVDGPYTEAKEAVGGFAVYELETREEAMEWARKFLEAHQKHWPAWEGEAVVRQIIHYR